MLAHARALLTCSEEGATDYIDADLRNTGTILTQAARLLDFTRPVAITLIAILHAIPDSGDPYAIVATLMDAVPSGSYRALSHSASDLLHVEQRQGLEKVTSRMIQQQFTYRSREQVAGSSGAWTWWRQGLVRVEEWRPDPGTSGAGKSHLWCAAGRKR